MGLEIRASALEIRNAHRIGNPEQRIWCAIALSACLAAMPACQPARREVRKVVPGGPQVQATVVTIRTTVEPSKKTSNHLLLIGPQYARSTADTGIYRLFDLKNDRVLFINEFAKNYRVEPLQSLVRQRTAAAASTLSHEIPRAQYSTTGSQRVIAGVPARQSVVRLGAYQRELWLGSHPLIPAQLFAMDYASTAAAPSEPIAHDVDAALLSLRGYPLLDRAELPYGNQRIVVDRAVVSVVRRQVPLSLLTLPAGFADVTPRATAPGANRRPASSPPRGRSTRGAG